MVKLKEVYWLKDISKEKVEIAGGKGANLSEIYNLKLPVPNAFIISAQSYKTFLEKNQLASPIYNLLRDLDVEDSDKLRETAEKIQEMIIDADMPEPTKRKIIEAYENLNVSVDINQMLNKQVSSFIKAGRDLPYVAVRSSATAEDNPKASFAGQMSTFLNIKGNTNLIKAVQGCWASLFTARAIYYRVKNNFPHEKVLIAVIIQKQIHSDKSGVIFSVNPVTNNENEILMEAVFGLGEAIVSGAIRPDQYILDKETLEIKNKIISEKDFELYLDINTKETKKRILDEEKRKEQVLTESEIKKLAGYTKIIDAHYKFPQDIEFAVEGANIYIVQTRPITTLKKPEELKEEKEEIKEHGEVILKGLAASPHIGTGKVKIVKDISELAKIQQGDILVAKMTNPDYVTAMERANGIITDEGGTTAHAAIVSREMGIACVVGTEKATEVLKDNDLVTVDGVNGLIYKGEVEIKEEKEIIGKEEIPVTATKIYMNLGEPDIIDKYKDLNFDGIGLMRLEFLITSKIGKHPNFLIKNNEQDFYVDELVNGISKVASAINPRPLIVRFSDFKTNEYRNLEGGSEYEEHEDNPMIGWRGVSRYISREFREAFKLECKAIKKITENFDNVNVMLPFVRNTDEVKKCLEIMKEENLERNHKLKIFLMAEVPSIALIPEEFAKLDIDGVSIGSNDLTQLVLGVDRDSARLYKLGYFDERNNAVLEAMKRIIKSFKDNDKLVSICGQAPSVYPEIVEFLVKNKIDSISVNPDAVNKTRRLVASVERKILMEMGY